MPKGVPKSGRKLNPRQKAFAVEYCRDFNAMQAALRAGYAKGYSRAMSHKLLEHLGIQEAIAEERKRLAKDHEVTADRVIKEMARLAFMDPRKYYDEAGALKHIKDLDDDTGAAPSR